MTRTQEKTIISAVQAALKAAGYSRSQIATGDMDSDDIDNIAHALAEQFEIEEDELRYLACLPR